MPILEVYVTEETLAKLKQEADDRGRTVEDLADCALSEAVLRTQLRDKRDA